MDRRDFLKYILASAALLTVAQRTKIEELIVAAPETESSPPNWGDLGWVLDRWVAPVKTAANLPEVQYDRTLCWVESEDRGYVYIGDVGWVPITTAKNRGVGGRLEPVC